MVDIYNTESMYKENKYYYWDAIGRKFSLPIFCQFWSAKYILRHAVLLFCGNRPKIKKTKLKNSLKFMKKKQTKRKSQTLATTLIHKILFSPLEDKIHIFPIPLLCNILYI
jgi:hypothetical protein